MPLILTSIDEIQWSDFIRADGPIHLLDGRLKGTMQFELGEDQLYSDLEDDYNKYAHPRIQCSEDDVDRERYLTYRDAILNAIRGRHNLMFRSRFKHDPERVTFLDLPAEVRNMIYDYALFDYKHSRFWDIDLCGSEAGCSRDNGPKFQTELTISTLKMLGAMNKQIRLEARSRFWGTVTTRFYPTRKEDHDLLGQFLHNISPDCAGLLKTLYGREYSDPKCLSESHPAFQGFIVALKCCHKLRILQFNLSVSNVFRGNKEALRSYFLDGKTLESPGLNNLANVLISLPSLKKVDIWNAGADEWNDNCARRLKSEKPFFRFAFSGLRRQKLWIATYRRLRANHQGQKKDERKLDDRIVVRMNNPRSPYAVHSGSDTLDYEAWLAWYHTLCADPNHGKQRWHACSCKKRNELK